MLRKVVFFPFSLIYGSIVALRNWLYDIGLIRSYRSNLPSLVIGNLSLGGTGKSPHVEYFIRKLQDDYKLAVVSRGYGRKTKGYLKVELNSDAGQVGDEPLQIKLKFPQIPFSVCENRVQGIKQIIAENPTTELIILDDAMQHRAVSGGFVVMLSMFDNPFFKDWVVPAGTLREIAYLGKKRTNVCVFTKCPNELNPVVKAQFSEAFSNEKPTFFSSFSYDSWQLISKRNMHDEISKVLLVTGIAYPKPLLDELKKKYEVEHISFGDHHEYSEEDILSIHRKFTNFGRQNSAIVCTEKDAVKLKAFDSIASNDEIPWFSIPIRVKIENEQELLNQIHQYVKSYSRGG